MIETKELKFGIYGKCLSISNGKIEVYVTLDFGPRICRCAFVGGENFFKEFEDFGNGGYLGDDCKFDDNRFFNRGGHRFWLSPESKPRTTYPDNKPIEYKITPNGAIFTQSVQEINEVQLSIEIEMSETENKLSITHNAKNTGYWPKEFSTWAISVSAQGGTQIIPQNTCDTGLLPNRFLSIWPYTDINDPRLTLGNKYIRLEQNPEIQKALKIGLMQEHTWAMYFHHDDLFVKTYEVNKNAKYPDNNCTYETYVCGKFIELETLGELKLANPGETNSHTETWYLYEGVKLPETDEEVDALKEKYNLN
ncbi:MAG: hypothetical protein J6V03_05375 [Clostridia bacterium]|nr:hypothetical protein [Clostridia bacterium]